MNDINDNGINETDDKTQNFKSDIPSNQSSDATVELNAAKTKTEKFDVNSFKESDSVFLEDDGTKANAANTDSLNLKDIGSPVNQTAILGEKVPDVVKPEQKEFGSQGKITQETPKPHRDTPTTILPPVERENINYVPENINHDGDTGEFPQVSEAMPPAFATDDGNDNDHKKQKKSKGGKKKAVIIASVIAGILIVGVLAYFFLISPNLLSSAQSKYNDAKNEYVTAYNNLQTTVNETKTFLQTVTQDKIQNPNLLTELQTDVDNASKYSGQVEDPASSVDELNNQVVSIQNLTKDVNDLNNTMKSTLSDAKNSVTEKSTINEQNELNEAKQNLQYEINGANQLLSNVGNNVTDLSVINDLRTSISNAQSVLGNSSSTTDQLNSAKQDLSTKESAVRQSNEEWINQHSSSSASPTSSSNEDN